MRPLLKFLQPTITDYVPFDYGSSINQSSGSKSSNPSIRNLVPDIKITKNNTDYPGLVSTKIQVPETVRSDLLTNLDVLYKAIEVTFDLDTNDRITETSLSNFLFNYTENDITYNVFWTNTRSMNLNIKSTKVQEDNLEAFNSPGIVLHIQTGNREDEDGNPVFNPYGNLTQGLGNNPFAPQDDVAIEGF